MSTIQQISSVGLKPNGFTFDIQRYPEVDFPVQAANIPAISMGSAVQNTPQAVIKHPGERLTYGELTIEFLLNSDMSNYIQLFAWMRQNASPQMPTDFATLQQKLIQNQDNGQEYFSDVTLNMLDNNNNPTVGFNFVDAFPVSLSEINVATTISGEEYLTCTATFDYTYFNVVKL